MGGSGSGVMLVRTAVQAQLLMKYSRLWLLEYMAMISFHPAFPPCFWLLPFVAVNVTVAVTV